MTEPKKPRGFAAMSDEQRRAVSAKGGRSVPAENRSYSKNKALASAAGKKARAKGETNG